MLRLLCAIYLCSFFSFGLCARPNVLFILTDDQDLQLNGMLPMTNVIKFIADKGVTFLNAFVNSPICCPSRSSILTGRLPHNTGVKNNSISGGCSSRKWRYEQEPLSLASIFKQYDYNTFYAGKYLNQYGTKDGGTVSHIPVGWDNWYGLVGNSKYYNYTLSENGKAVRYKNVYLTDLIRNKAISFLNNATRSKSNNFLMVLAPPAPHAPFTAAPRHEYACPTVFALQTPAFNFTPVKKHWLLTMPPVHLPEEVPNLDEIARNRCKSLMAVDELVLYVVAKLTDTGEINNTIIIFTSDNGYHIGQFGQPYDKRQPYDTDIRVPLFIRGPNIRERLLYDFPVQSVDLAPTILDAVNIPIPTYMDGQSLLQQDHHHHHGWTKNILIEYHGEGNAKTNDNQNCPFKNDDSLAECVKESWCKCQDSKNNTYNCVRRMSADGPDNIIEDFLFCKFQDSENFVEAYDMIYDTYQLNNIYDLMEKEKIIHYNLCLNALLNCHGENCTHISNSCSVY